MKVFKREDLKYNFKAPINYVEEVLNHIAYEAGIIPGSYDVVGKARDIFFELYKCKEMQERFSRYPEVAWRWFCDAVDINALETRYVNNFDEEPYNAPEMMEYYAEHADD